MRARGQTYCQIYCQKRGGEGILGDGEFQDFSNLLISIYVYEGSNPTLSATSVVPVFLLPNSGDFGEQIAICIT